MKTTTKPVARYWALGNRGGWGEGHTIEAAVKRATSGGWAGKSKGKLGDGDEFIVYELDLALPVTHISDENGHALHRKPDAKRGPMGRYDDDVHPYRRTADGTAFEKPMRFGYSKGAVSDAGRHLAAITTQ